MPDAAVLGVLRRWHACLWNLSGNGFHPGGGNEFWIVYIKGSTNPGFTFRAFAFCNFFSILYADESKRGIAVSWSVVTLKRVRSQISDKWCSVLICERRLRLAEVSPREIGFF